MGSEIPFHFCFVNFLETNFYFRSFPQASRSRTFFSVPFVSFSLTKDRRCLLCRLITEEQKRPKRMLFNRWFWSHSSPHSFQQDSEWKNGRQRNQGPPKGRLDTVWRVGPYARLCQGITSRFFYSSYYKFTFFLRCQLFLQHSWHDLLILFAKRA